LFTSNTSNYYANLLQNWSTSLSTATLFTSNTSNYSRGFLQDWSTAVSTATLFTSNTSNYSRGILQDWSTAVSTATLFTSNTSNYYKNNLQDWSASVTSSLIGLATFGYISTSQFQSTQVGMFSNISSLIDPVELASTIVGLGTIGFTSSIGLTAILNSTVTGLTSNISSMIDPVELASTVVGLGTIGLISSTQLDKYLASTTSGLGTAGYVSTAYATQLSNYYKNTLQDWSTGLSTISLFTSNTSNTFAGSSGPGISSLFGVVSTGLSTIALFTSNTSNYYKNNLQDWSTLLLSTTAGLGTATYISSAQLTSSLTSILTYYKSLSVNISTLTTSNLNGLTGYISSLQVDSLQFGNGTGWVDIGPIRAVALSTIQLNVDIIYANQVSSSTFAGDGSQLVNLPAISSLSLQSTLRGLGTAGYVSTAYTTQLSNYFQNTLQNWSVGLSTTAQFTSNTSNYFQNTLQNYSTMFSTAVSTATLFTSNTSNYYANLLQNYSTAVSTATLFTSNTSNYFTNTFQNWSTPLSTSAQFTSNTSNYYANLLQNYSTMFSTAVSTATLFTSNTSNYFANTLQNWSTAVSTTSQFTSNTSNWSFNLLQNYSTMFSTAVSTATLFTSNTSNYYSNLLQNWSTSLSTTALFTSNTSNYFQNTLQNWSTPVSTASLFTSNTSNYFQNTLQNWSTGLSTIALFTSNTSNYYTNVLQNWSSAVSTAALFTSNTSNYSRGFLQDWSTAVSTIALFTSNTSNTAVTARISTADGLGSLGYISSLQLQSTTKGLQEYVSSQAAYPANTTGQVLYLNYSIPNTSPYKSLQTTPTLTPTLQSTFQTIARTLSNQSVSQFRTDFTLPPFIPDGIWDINLYAKSAYSHSYIWASLHEVNGGDDIKYIANTSNNPIQVTPANIITPFTLSLVVPYTNISTGNSISLRLYANNVENQDDQLTTYYEDGEYSHVHTTFGIIIPLDLLTSTTAGLGTAGYISTAQYNTLSNYYKNTLQDWSTSISTATLFTSNTSNYFTGLIGSTLSLSTGNVTTSSLYFKDPYAASIAMFQSSSLLFYGNVVLAGYGQLQPQLFTF
jgi:hypothetical protein